MWTEPQEGSDSAFPGTERFEIRAVLGRGGTGVVYEAFDRQSEDLVALKTLRGRSVTDLARIKREFRTLADVRHRNLVSLYELHHHDGTWFFTMELVRGVSFLDWIWMRERDRVRADRRRLEDTLPQLVAAVDVLHAAGHLHRDLKPSNVIVDAGGRVVVLDFGLASLIGQREVWGGTPGYVAPEVLRGAELTAWTDWFSLGAMLYEAIHGHTPDDDLGKHAVSNAHELEDLAAVSASLLDDDSARRDPVLSRLRGRTAEPRQLASALIGRDPQLAALERARARTLDGGPVLALVHGPSGIGKTRCLRAHLESLEPSTISFSGSCHEREMIPFRAFDGVVEGIVHHVRNVGVPRLSPVHAYAIARLFPAFLTIHAVATTAGTIGDPPDPQTLRRLGFSALRILVSEVSASHPIVISIDDLHWGDSDSAELMTELLDARDARLLVLVTCRTNGQLPGLLPEWWHALLDHPRAVEIAIPPLAPEETAALVRGGGRQLESDLVERIAAESGGSPYFATELVRHVRSSTTARLPSLDAALEMRLAELSELARSLGECIAVAGRPLERDAVFAIAGHTNLSRASLSELQRARIVSIRETRSGPVVELVHDRLRRAVIAATDPLRCKERQRQVGEALEHIPRYAAEADLVFTLFSEAGDRVKAVRYGERAAERAANAFAFHQAAELYRGALACADADDLRRRLERRLADVLADGGRGAFAGPIYDRLASAADPDEAITLRQRAMDCYLTSGHLDEGLRVLRSLCRKLELPFPATPGRAFVASLPLMLRARLRGRSRPPAQASRRDRVRIDASFAAAKGLIGSDPMRGAYFAFRALDLAARAGDVERTTRFLAFVGAAILASAGGTLERWGNRMLDEAAREVERRGDPELVGTLLVCKGQTAILEGRWRDALTSSDGALAILGERCRNVAWEMNFARMGALRALEELGDQRESMTRVERFLRESAQGGDVYARVTAGIWRGLHRVVLGDIAGARDDADAALRAWTLDGYHVQHLYAMRVQFNADLHEGRPDVALGRLERDWRAIKASFLMRVPTGRIDVMSMRGRGSLALATTDHRRRDALLADATRAAQALRREVRPDARAQAALLDAGVLSVRGDRVMALTLLAAAQSKFEALSMDLLAAGVAHRRGELESGTTGAERRSRAAQVIAANDVSAPAAWLAVCAPGF